MKKQMGILILALAMAQLAAAFVASRNVERIDIEQRMARERISREAVAGKDVATIQKESGTHLNAFAKSSGASPEHIAQILARKNGAFLDVFMYVDMVATKSDATTVDKLNADNAKTIISNFGLAKGVNAADQAAAKAEAPAVQKMLELFPMLASYGPKALKVGEVWALETKAGLSLNKGLRSAVRRVLGLDGEALEKFMRDPNEGLANCKI